MVDVELQRDLHEYLTAQLTREPNVLPELRQLEIMYYGETEKEEEWRELMCDVFWVFREKEVLRLTVGDPQNRGDVIWGMGKARDVVSSAGTTMLIDYEMCDAMGVDIAETLQMAIRK